MDVEHLRGMAALVESLDEAILGVDLEGTIRSWNRAAARTFGWEAADAVGSPATMLVPPEERPVVERWWRALVDGTETARHDVAALRSNGVALRLAVTVSAVHDPGGALTGASVIARDVTRQRWMAATLEATLASLEQALHDARESEAASRRFLADAAHQLRTPLAGIRANAETLLRGSGEEERDELLLNVVRETSRAGRVMAGLLRLARVDSGEVLTFRPCDVAAVCADEVLRCRALSPELEVDVQVAATSGRRPRLDADVVREVVANLLDNARRHAGSRVAVVVDEGPETVEVRVTDDGPGLAGAAVERAFERFVSLDGQGGSGLGLPIARGLARAHGGDLLYDDGFVLRLPAQAPEVGCGGAARPGPLPPTVPTLPAEPFSR
ncbi:MAG: ATP-binding protein [Acidimicrobiales bacterium]